MKLVLYAMKPKGERLMKAFQNGARRAGYDCYIKRRTHVVPGAIGVFYGVTNQTYSIFRFYMAEGRAIYIDNGWLSTPNNKTFRFTWNGAQTYLLDMPVSPAWNPDAYEMPDINWNPRPKDALLILQSPEYFEYMRLGYTKEQWERATTTILEQKGYNVFTRAKPTKQRPEIVPFLDTLERASIVVSLNSASTVKSLSYGIPSFCTLDSTLSPLAPVRIPEMGRAAPPNLQAVDDMRARMWSYEMTQDEMSNGNAIERIMAVPPEKRRGIWYGS